MPETVEFKKEHEIRIDDNKIRIAVNASKKHKLHTSKEKLSHVKKVNKLYGTNFRAFRKNGVWQLLNNTNEYNKLKLSENLNEPKQQENQVTELAKLGKNLRENQCK